MRDSSSAPASRPSAAGRCTTWSRKISRRLVLCALLLAPLAAPAQDLGDGRLALIDDPLRVALDAPVRPERLREAVGVAAQIHDWQISERPDGLLLTRSVRGRHQVSVLLSGDTQGYTLRYVSSFNLLYSDHDRTGRPARVIHHNYNVWVRELAAGVNSALRLN